MTAALSRSRADGRESQPEATSADLLAVYTRRESDGTQDGATSSRWQRFVWMLRASLSFGRVRFELTRAAQGAAIARMMANRSVPLLPTRWRIRFGYAVLELPATMERYLGGHQRRRLRKRLSRAGQRDISVRALTPSERSAAQRSLLTDVEPRRVETREAAQFWLGAFTGSSEPVAVIIALLDGETALLHTSQGRLNGRDIDIRYVLHTALVEQLIAAGARLLVTDSQNCFRISLALLQYQYHLGYEVRNIVWRRAAR